MAINYEKVGAYYNSNPESEWNRLAGDFKIEYRIITHYMNKFLPANSKVLDVGGGPGRYGVDLVKAGHEYNLIDLSEGNIEFAKKISKQHKVNFNSCEVGNAEDLSSWPDACFDVVINMGPMYHCLDATTRQKMIVESIRVLKDGGLLVLGFMSKYAVAYCQLNADLNNISFMRPTMNAAVELEYHVQSETEPGFTDAAYVEPMEIAGFMEQFPLTKKCIIGSEGLIAQSKNKLHSCSAAIQEEWIDYCIKTAESNGALNSSEHIIYFGAK